MTAETARPVIFLAFANEREDRVRYLLEEARRLRNTLEGG